MPRLEDDIAAVVDVIGASNVGAVWALGNHFWKSAEERDAFLQSIKDLGVDPNG